MITILYPANVTPTWALIAPLLSPAVAISGTHDIEDVRKAILCGNAQLWVDWNDGVDMATVTEFVSYPKGIWLRIWLAGARKGVEIDWDKVFEVITEFAYNNHCVGIENWGREGWTKYCPKAQKQAMILRFPLEKRGTI